LDPLRYNNNITAKELAMAILEFQKKLIEVAKQRPAGDPGSLDAIFRIAFMMGDEDTVEYIVKTQMDSLTPALQEQIVKDGLVTKQ